MSKPVTGPYYILIEEGKPPEVSNKNPDLKPSELKGKRLLMADGLRIQEYFYKGQSPLITDGWTEIERKQK